MLELSLPVLCADYRLAYVHLWGKIEGLQRDYYIAHGMTDDFVKDPRTFYSFDCVDWSELPQVTGALIASLHEVGITPATQMPFVGDPALAYGEDGAATELGRLALQVQYIAGETYVVPKRAFVPAEGGRVLANACFPGLAPGLARDPRSYTLRRDLVRTLLENPSGDPFVLETVPSLAEGPLASAWVPSYIPVKGLFTLRHRLIPGAVFFANSVCRQWGRAYWGSGLLDSSIVFE